MKKRILSMLLALVMIVGLVPSFAISTAAATDAVKVEHNGTTTYYENLQKAFDGFAPGNNTYGGKYVVTLLANVNGNLNKNLQYPTEVLDVTLDLNGYTITGDGTTIAVVINFGSKNSKDCTFTIKDSSGNDSGKITGGKGGVKVDGSGSFFNFEGGTITGNHGASKGGGILVGAKTKFIMTGGVITGNSVKGTSSANSGYGGGVLVNYGEINGGKIYGNTAYKGSHLQTGRGGGVCTEITRTTGYSTLTIASGTVYGNTAENAGDDVMAQGNGNVKFSLSIGTDNWYIDGWNGTKAGSGGGQTDRYDADAPVAYTDGGFTDVKNKTVGLKYVAPAEEEEAPTNPDEDGNTNDILIVSCDDDIGHILGYKYDPGFASEQRTYKTEDGKWAFEALIDIKGMADRIMETWVLNGTGEHEYVTEVPEEKVLLTALWNEELERWEYETLTIVVSCATEPVAPEAPTQFGENVTTSLVQVICDSEPDHEPMLIKWQHQSTEVRDWVSGVVWSDEYNTWIVPIRIDSIKVYYVWLNFEKANNDIVHELVDEEQSYIDTYLKWDEEAQLWVTLDEKPIDVHVTCVTTPKAPSAFQIKNYQIKVTGIVDGEEKVYYVYVDTANAVVGDVTGSREDGFTVDVTFPIIEDDAVQAGWIEQRDPDATVGDYIYDWSKTPESITITLEYTGDLVGDLYGDQVGDWALANGKTYGTIGEAYVIPSAPAAPKQANVTDKLVAIICDSDSDRHATVYGKWYPQHCKTTSDITWNAELNAWTVDVRIGSLYVMYVNQLEDANNGTIHELVDDITTVYTTLVWDVENELWVPEEDIELHTTCRTVPLAPTYNKQIKSYQVKVWGDVNGEEKAYTFSIPEDGYTIGEVYGSREEGFYVDITITLEDGDFYQTSWIEKKNPGYFYNYDWDRTPATVTFTLRYNGDLNGTLHGDRHAVNTNYDWVLDTNGKTFGVIAEAYLGQIKENVSIVIYRNGDTSKAYKSVSLGKIAKGEELTLSDYAIADYYENELGFEFYGWYNDGAWNQYKAGKNPAGLETITVNGWTNIICMVYDYEEVVVKAVVDGDKDNAEDLYTGKILYGTNIVEWLTANVTVEERIGYTLDKWFNWDSGEKIADDATVAGDTAIYVTYTANEYTISFDTDGGSEVAPITQFYGKPVSAPADPTKTGHTFTGWVREDGSAFSFDGYTMEAASFTLKATWKANTYSVTLVPNNGRINSGNVTEYTYGIGATLPTDVTRLGYKFLGWYDNPEFKGERVWRITETDIGDKVYFAKWELKTLPIIPGTYDVYVANSIKNGTVSVNKTTVPAGVSVKITVDPDSGFELSRLTVTTTRGQDVTVKQIDETTYKFTMPNCDVVVDAAFTETVVADTGCKRDETCPMYDFTDLDTFMWYHDGVHYCLENGLMEGYGNNIFKPDAETTRAMIVTILWRLEGSPEVDYDMTFEDVEDGMWYTEAIRWAASNGIVLGYDEETFGPDDIITREQLATILYRYEKHNGGGFTGLWMFKLDYVDSADVSDWAYEAMCWMTMNKIVQGKNDNVLDPQGGATRAEAATMLYRYCTKDEK